VPEKKKAHVVTTIFSMLIDKTSNFVKIFTVLLPTKKSTYSSERFFGFGGGNEDFANSLQKICEKNESESNLQQMPENL
jgi:hypothetical protein